MMTSNIFNSFFSSVGSFFRKLYRIIFGSIVGFIKDGCYLKAAALSFYMLLAIVPILAVALGIARGFGFQEHLEHQLLKTFQDQKEVLSYAVKIAYALLQHAQGSVIAGVGVILMFWTNLTLLGNIESALNEIWKIKKARSWSRKVGDYLATMILCPIFFIASNSLTVFLRTFLSKSSAWIIEPYLLDLLNFLPFVFAWLLFSFIYVILPNTKLHWWPRLLAGILAGTAFQAWQWIYVQFQVEIFNYNVVYGTFAALPLFLVWLQISFLIALAGAELAAHIESDLYISDFTTPDAHRDISQKELALYILYRAIQTFSKGDLPITASKIAKELEVSIHDVLQSIEILEQGNVLAEVSIKDQRMAAYQLLRDPKLFTLNDIFTIIDKGIIPPLTVKDSQILRHISINLENLNHSLENSQANISLANLVLPAND